LPLKIALPMGIWTPSNTWFLGPISSGSSTQTHLDRLSRFAGLTTVTDRQTDRPTDHATLSVSTARIYVRSTAVRPTKSSHALVQAREQVSVQISGKRCNSYKWRNSEFYGQRIRDDCTGDGEVSGAEYRTSGHQQISGAVCWPQMKPTRSRRTLDPTRSSICTRYVAFE